jgi:transposase
MDPLRELIAALEAARGALDAAGAENARLRQRVAVLEQALAASQRAGKRQAAPFSKSTPARDPKKPGRRSGPEHGSHGHRQVPDHVDEVIAVDLPERCSGCGDMVVEDGVATQYQEEIPDPCPVVTRFDIAVGHCRNCGRRVQGRHRRQVSDALGAAGVQLGPRAAAQAASLHLEMGLSYGRTAEVMRSATGMRVTRGGIVQAVARMGRRGEESYVSLCDQIAEAPVVTPDETGWRVGGHSAWLWTVTDPRTTVYAIERGRGADVIRSLLGDDYAGVVVRDGWAPYRQLDQARHQTCLAHLLRRCHELLAVAHGRGREVPRAVRALLGDALDVRDRRDAGELDVEAVSVAAAVLKTRLDALLRRPAVRHHGNRTLLAHLRREHGALFTFLEEPGIPATNWRAEQAIRPAVVNRKTWGGNRTWVGAGTQETMMTLFRTLRQRGHDPVRALVDLLRDPVPGLMPALAPP